MAHILSEDTLVREGKINFANEDVIVLRFLVSHLLLLPLFHGFRAQELFWTSLGSNTSQKSSLMAISQNHRVKVMGKNEVGFRDNARDR